MIEFVGTAGNFPPFQMMGGGLREGARGPAGRDRPTPEPAVDTSADAQGHFSLALPHGGAWRLEGRARGVRTQTFNEHDGFYSKVVLTDASPNYALTLRMTADSAITGVVFDEAGEPVRQARLSAELMPPQVPGQLRMRPRTVGSGTTDDRGHFEITGLAPGAYRVRLQAQPWYASGLRGSFGGGTTAVSKVPAGQPPNDFGASLDPSLDVVYATTWYPGADSEEGAELIKLAGGEERQADFHLNAVAAVHLRISRPEQAPAEAPAGRPRPMPMAIITKLSGEGGFNSVASVSGIGTGDWDFGGLTPGVYEVRLPGPDGQQGGAEVRQIEILPGSRGVVTLEGAKELTKVSVQVEGVSAGAFPQVEFTDLETGRRIVASESRDRRGRRGEEAGDNEGDGTLIATLPPHRYAVSITRNDGIFITGMSATDARVVGHTVEIGSGSPHLILSVASGRAELKGEVLAGTKPVEGAMVLLVPVGLGQPGDVSTVVRAQSNTDGSFAYGGLIPGQYIAVAIADGWAVRWTSPEALAKYLPHGVPIELHADAKATETLEAVLP